MNAVDNFKEWWRSSIGLKLFTIGFLVLILLYPKSLVEDLINERQTTFSDVTSEIGNQWGGPQNITGPLLSIPYKKTIVKTINNRNNQASLPPDSLFYEEAHTTTILPDILSISGKIMPQPLKRGIYKVVTYETVLEISGKFPAVAFDEWTRNNSKPDFSNVTINIGIPYMIGIQDNITLLFGDKSYDMEPGVNNNFLFNSGVSTKVELIDNKEINFCLRIRLNGSSELNFVPIGKETKVSLESSWKDPSFCGSFIPDYRSIDENGFKANWKILHLNRNFPQKWNDNEHSFENSQFGVELMIAVDHYQKATRSVKYAILFILLTFTIFFFIEILNKTKIHPIQYMLVGFGLILFFSLLIALSEHIGFNLSYLISSISIIIIITFFASRIFANTKTSIILCCSLCVLYIFLFALLQLAEYSLLLGNIGLLATLVTVMYYSSKINWYKIKRERTIEINNNPDIKDITEN